MKLRLYWNVVGAGVNSFVMPGKVSIVKIGQSTSDEIIS